MIIKTKITINPKPGKNEKPSTKPATNKIEKN